MAETKDLLQVKTLLQLYDEMSPEEQNRFDLLRIERSTKQGLEMLRRDHEADRADTQARLDAVERSQKLIADAGARRALHADKYYTRSAIGGLFAPNISAKRMTKLLRLVGIIGKQDFIVTQYMRGQQPLARRRANTDYPTWEFHVDKLTATVDKWLSDHELYEDFHATVTKDERDAFIDQIYEEYSE